jgi:membrane-bound metal-dependent hydrolase YbcI (DUF457 family)
VPSPIGHALAGAAVALAGDAIDRRRSSLPFIATCAALAVVADFDLLVPGHHRSYTHSVTAVAFVFIVAAAVTERVTRWRVGLICAGAYATHLLLDWLGADLTRPPFGIQVLWPFVDRFFMSGLNVFVETERRNPFSHATIVQNLWAAAREVAILGPVVAALWLVRVKTLSRLPSQVARRDHAAQ